MNTPMNTKDKLILDNEVEKKIKKHYISLIEWLIYFIHSRSDIIFVISLLSRFMDKPNKYHFGIVKRVLRYIKRILNYGICYKHIKDFKIYSYINCD